MIWEVSDELWEILQDILDELNPPAETGRPRTDPRAAFNGIIYIYIYQMRSGCQWNHAPPRFGDDSSVHCTMQRWIAKGAFRLLWAVLLENCEELGGQSR